MLIACSVLSVCTGATETPLRFGVIKIGYPIGFLDTAQKPSGVYADITTVLIEKLAVEATMEVLPFPRLLRLMDQSAIDCAIFFTSDERKQKYHHIGFIVKRPMIIVGSDRFLAKNVTGLEGFHGKNIGFIRHTNRDDPLHLDNRITKYLVDSYENGVEMLRLNRIDGFYGAKDIIDELYDTKGNFFINKVAESWLQCSKQTIGHHSDLFNELTRAVKELHGDSHKQNVILSIHQNYFDNYQLFQ